MSATWQGYSLPLLVPHFSASHASCSSCSSSCPSSSSSSSSLLL
eukprot:CAMPEP_0197577216 /NCGR_PEP_ID=MMETSP1326-20131121/1928_1 /TAXON_ID=1155430 /ORGANISM="Genus nov. species nov., Strain RCC2288" /LENGTH=43 /DNA_ID= /DNA_START= /DNA_END= /DNA_ORIENTATION=